MSPVKQQPLLIFIASAAMSAGVTLTNTAALADPLGYSRPYSSTGAVERILREPAAASEPQDATEIDLRFRRRIVDYATRETAGTIVVDTRNTYLYLVLGQGRAIRYGIGVGREGFTWAGTQSIARKQEWPDWHPPAEMIERQPYLPRMMAGGPGNPLGARAMYLGNTVYRIHGTNAPDTIGQRVSSGCIRLTNDDVIDLYGHVTVGTKVVVLPVQPTVAAVLSERAPSISNLTRASVADGMGVRGLY